MTPLDEQGNFASNPFERLLERVYATGIDGLYVNGNTGEGLLQPVEQRKRVTEAAVRCSPKDKSVIVHVGAYRTADALELANHASMAGAHAVASLPPLGSYSFAEVRGYYEALAATSELPVFVYYFPAVCPVIQAAEQALELLKIPNVVGFKFTDFDLYKLSLIKKTGCLIYNGHDEVLAAGLLMGADGGIGSFYNLIPELFVEVQRLANAGEWEKTRPVQGRINELIRICLQFPLVPAIKTVLRWSGIDCGEAIEPRRRLTDDEQARLRSLLLDSPFAYLLG